MYLFRYWEAKTDSAQRVLDLYGSMFAKTTDVGIVLGGLVVVVVVGSLVGRYCPGIVPRASSPINLILYYVLS